MVTTRGAEKGPAGMQDLFVIYMETFLFSSKLRIGSPAASMAFSNEKLHPSKKLTVFSVKYPRTSSTSVRYFPFSKIL